MALNVSGGSLSFVAEIENSSFGASIRKMEEDLKRLTQTANTESAAMEGFAQKAALAVGSYLSVNAAKDFIGQIVSVRGEFQKLEAVLTNSLGSNALAKSALGMVADYAARTPFQLTEVANAYIKLVNQGFKPTSEELANLGDLAASTNKSFDQVAEAVIDAQRGQFVRLEELGINAVRAGDKVRFSFKDITTEVDNTSESIRKYVTGLGQLNGVAGTTASISGTIEGQISNLKDAFDRMLNALGESSEGAISTTIKGLNVLVDHYQDVIDILKVIALTYGVYRAAIIANTLAVSGATIAETLHYGALVIAEKAQKLLNLTMLANPYVLLATAIGAVVTSLIVFGDEATNAKSKAQLLADAQKKVTDNLAETEGKFRPYLEQLKATNLSENDRLSIFEKIRVIDPDILKGIDAKTLSYEKLKNNVDIYLASLRKQIDLEANKSALTESIKQEQDFDKQIKVAERQAKDLAKIRSGATGSLLGFGVTGSNSSSEYITRLQKERDDQKKITAELANGQQELEDSLKPKASGGVDDQVGKLGQLTKAITELKKAQSEKTNTSQDFKDYQTQIDNLEKQAEAIRGKSKAALAAQKKDETEINRILQERASLLENLAGLHRDAEQSGLTKEASEIDRINEKYDVAIKKVQEFNAAHKSQKINIADLNDDRATEVNNALLKQQADLYIQNLENQKDAFAQFEEAKKTLGIDKAKEMYAGQTKSFDTYLDYLQSERQKLVAAITVNGIDVGTSVKLIANSKQTVEAQKAAASASIQQLAAITNATQSAADKRLLIEQKYQSDVKLAQAKFSGDDLANRVKVLSDTRQQDLTELDDNLARQSNLYRNLNTDVIRYTKDQLKQRLDLLKQYLKDGFILESNGTKTVITPEMKESLKSGIQQAQGLYNTTKEVFGLGVDKLNDLDKYAKLAGVSLGDLAESVRPLNESLANALTQLSQMANLASSAASAAAGFASGDYAAGISGAVGVLSGLLKAFTSSRTSAIAASKEIADFNAAITVGELNINIAYRERLRLQAQINDLKIDGLQKERALLEQEKLQSTNDFNKLLDQIQGLTFVSGEHTEKKKSFLGGLVGYLTGFGSTTEVQKEFSSLVGKSYDDLNKLFQSGQLEGKAKELFEQLQRLKQEGVDIDAAIAQSTKDAQEIFAGTTADNITNSIADGFSEGFRSVEQFAGKTEDIIRGAMLNALKYQVLEGPIKKIFEQFAKDAESNGSLDQDEIANFTENINKTIKDAALFTEQIEKATGVSLTNATASANQNSLQGAVKSISQQSADLLAGQFGGLRITAVEQLKTADDSLRMLSKIEQNTAAAVVLMSDYYGSWSRNGLRVNIQ